MNKQIPLLLLLLLLLLQSVFTDAQINKIDSLKQALQNEKQDTGRVMLLNELSFAYVTSKPDTALFLAQQAVTIARQKSI